MLPLSSVSARLPILSSFIACLVGAAACATTPARNDTGTEPATPNANGLEHGAPHATPADARYAVLARQANDDLRHDRFAAALERADAALALLPFGLEAGLAKVEAHLQLGQRTAALDYATRLVDAHPRSSPALYAQGRALMALSQTQDAAPVFQAAVQTATTPLDETFALLGALTALAYDVQVELSELERRSDELATRVSADLDPRPDALHALGIACELRKLPEARATAYYEAALALRPEAHPWAHFNLARLLDASTGRAAARPHFQAFVAQAPPSAHAEVERIQKLLREDTP